MRKVERLRASNPLVAFFTFCFLTPSMTYAEQVTDVPSKYSLKPTAHTTVVPGTPAKSTAVCADDRKRRDCEKRKDDIKREAQKIFEKYEKNPKKTFSTVEKTETNLTDLLLAQSSGDSSSGAATIAMLQSIGILATSPSVLVLYDGPSGVAFSKLGSIYAIMLSNLLGHFSANVELKNVAEYAVGDVENYDAAFYLGSYFDNPLPASFLQDVSTTEKTVVWFRYNIWQMAWDSSYDFPGNFGLSFYGLRGLDSTPSEANPNPGFFDTVSYKNTSLVKYFDYDIDSGAVNADPDSGWMAITDPSKAEQLVSISNSQTGESMPYISRSGNFWYFADLPLSYIGPRDRYLVLCDILHDILGVDHPTTKYAMLRIEDVASLVNFSNMRTLSNFLVRRNIPFTITAVPFYRDPNGVFNEGVTQEIHMSDSASMLDSLDYAVARGAKISLHGYTHQYKSEANPYSGVTGDDFEFWHIPNNAPVSEDSEAWAAQRMLSGYYELVENGYMPYTWTTPHYQASPNAYRAFTTLFDSRYERTIYYSATSPELNRAVEDPARDFAAGQFFPYIIQSDYYNAKIYPENLGNIEYDIREIDPASFIDYSWEEVYLNAVYAEVIRDGVGSFFFHPFWLERELGVNGYSDFRHLVNGISNLGYQWVTPDEI